MAEAASLVPLSETPGVWPLVQDVLAAALGYCGDHTAESARQKVLSGEWQLWLATDRAGLVAAAVTECCEYPAQRVMYVIGAGGEMVRGMRMLWPLIRRHAALMECDVVRFIGRRGWARAGVLPAGWHHAADIVEVVV